MVLASTVRTSPCRQTGGASGHEEHTVDAQISQQKDDNNNELSGGNVCYRELTADVSEAAAALGPGGHQSLVVSAGRNVGLT